RTVAPPKQSPISWVEAVGKSHETANVSEETRNVLLAAWRQNTSSAYASAWSKWVSWCDQRKINPLSTSIESILEFLTGQYKEGKAYRSINVYRSALSAVLPLIDSWKVGSHPLVSQLLRGIFNLRPPQPKYSHTWKVSQLLGYIKPLGPNENLSLKNLSFKLVTLLGLTAPDRSSDLAKRDLRWRIFHPEGVSFSLSGLSKTSKPGDSPKTSFHATFKEDKDLCPVECLKFYEIKTKEFRSGDEHNKLFLSHILPHNPLINEAEGLLKEEILERGRLNTINGLLEEKLRFVKELDEKIIEICEVVDIANEIDEAEELVSRVLDTQRHIFEKTQEVEEVYKEVQSKSSDNVPANTTNEEPAVEQQPSEETVLDTSASTSNSQSVSPSQPESTESAVTPEKPKAAQPKPPPHGSAAALVANGQPSGNKIQCVYCSGHHFSASCTTTNEVHVRLEILKRDRRCFVCLKRGHRSNQCLNQRGCRRCNGRHHQSICNQQIPTLKPDAHEPAAATKRNEGVHGSQTLQQFQNRTETPDSNAHTVHVQS
ncbi:Poly P3, partial [Paramuricea clavata]